MKSKKVRKPSEAVRGRFGARPDIKLPGNGAPNRREAGRDIVPARWQKEIQSTRAARYGTVDAMLDAIFEQLSNRISLNACERSLLRVLFLTDPELMRRLSESLQMGGGRG